ncbi:DUF21 domain-containing protein [Desulfopila sp. IMCC35008]|uniref:DUF21 domain-containing protein n=1 Tax=Desulfopila sp. IMCC35008 TaxID=2653858 RepID=UPI001F0D417E|nr:CNNM domain-containing protein [Desulfopila sp. IMCC35008]
MLTTILLGNVGINVLLTLLSNQVLAGITAFLFSTVFITALGEIIPQAYFSRHALQTAALLSLVLKLYQIILYPFAKPTAFFLDKWLGKEGIHFYKEQELRDMIDIHMKSATSEIDAVEGRGALNFLNLDDMAVSNEEELVDPGSVIMLPFTGRLPHFPEFNCDPEDPFLKGIQQSGKKWVVITDTRDVAHYALDADSFLREIFFFRETTESFTLLSQTYCGDRS